MGQALLINEAANGGFPIPLADEPTRVVSALHAACGETTRVRLPRTLPAGIVHRVNCSGCGETFDATNVKNAGGLVGGLELPELSLPKIDPSSRAWRIASVPLAAAAVIGGLLLIQGAGDDPAQTPASDATAANSAAAKPGASDPGATKANIADSASLIQGSSYTLALPAGWDRVDPGGGATFSAASADATADATLWIEEKPSLDFPTFIQRSLAQLEGLAGSARVVERVPAPTPEGTIVRLAADAPPGQPTAEVLLRAAGPYRYYLLTTTQPGASREALDGVELISGSFTPTVTGR